MVQGLIVPSTAKNMLFLCYTYNFKAGLFNKGIGAGKTTTLKMVCWCGNE